MFHISRVTVLTLVVMTLHWSVAQEPKTSAPKPDAPSAKPPAKTKAAKDSADAKPKLTPDQLLAHQTLELAESQARGLDAPMRCYSLLQIAAAYAASDQPKARGLLQDAFSVSLAIQDDDQTKSDLQTEIFRVLLPISPSDVEERLVQAEPDARKQASQVIIGNYVQKKQFDKAMHLIQQVTSWDEFPYGAATSLLDAMPPEMNAEKQSLFASAVASYRVHEHNKRTVTFGGDLTALVTRFGESMPPKLAREAIDEILSQARKADDTFAITAGGSGGSASFSSIYEFQLFALLPLLRKLDESGAQHLLEENATLKITMDKYPNGIDSVMPLSPGKDGQPPRRNTSFNVTNKNAGGKAASDMAIRQEIQRRQDLILQLAETDPTQAIAQASMLPVTIGSPRSYGPAPRATTLEALARLTMKKNPTAARSALSELRKAIKDLPLGNQARHLATAANLYLQMEDVDRAEDVVGEGLSVAGKMLDIDINPDDPNKALKAWWPSADAYRQFVEIETKISHPATAKLLQEIKDPDVRTVESITFARALLAVPLKRFKVVAKIKSGSYSDTYGEP
ncbi:MAG: hypothetical protein LAO20_17990 [Acidobacteriia bacterium]|nr:hypothetical protein [Terriglobia bacterium]